MPKTTFEKDVGLPASALPPGPGYIIDPTGKIVVPGPGGAKATYYPSVTAGKLDLFSKEVPGDVVRPHIKQNTPYGVVDTQLENLWQEFNNQARNLRNSGLTAVQYNRTLTNMQADYDERKSRILGLRNQLDAIKRNVEDDIIDSKLGNEAMWRLVLPPEHAAAMFPRPVAVERERVPLSPSALESHGALMEAIAAETPETQRGWKWEPLTGFRWGFPTRTFENMLIQYDKWRDQIGYDNFTLGQQKQLDIKWDAVMKIHKEYEWNSTDPRIKARRTYGQQLLNATSKKIPGGQKTPFAQAITVQTPPTTKRIRVRAPNGTIGTIPVSQKKEAITSGYEVLE
jgi:hypothetical protein